MMSLVRTARLLNYVTIFGICLTPVIPAIAELWLTEITKEIQGTEKELGLLNNDLDRLQKKYKDLTTTRYAGYHIPTHLSSSSLSEIISRDNAINERDLGAVVDLENEIEILRSKINLMESRDRALRRILQLANEESQLIADRAEIQKDQLKHEIKEELRRINDNENKHQAILKDIGDLLALKKKNLLKTRENEVKPKVSMKKTGDMSIERSEESLKSETKEKMIPTDDIKLPSSGTKTGSEDGDDTQTGKKKDLIGQENAREAVENDKGKGKGKGKDENKDKETTGNMTANSPTNVFLVDHFEGPQEVNFLGFEAGIYERRPSSISISAVDTTINDQPTRVIKLDFDKNNEQGPYDKGGWCGYYSKVKNVESDAFFDGAKYQYLSFWAKGETGKENFVIGLADKKWDALGGSEKSKVVTNYTESGKILKKWQKIKVPLSDFAIDKSMLASIFISFESNCFPDGEGRGTLYIDNLQFE